MLVLLTGCILSVRPLSDDFSDASPADALRLTIDRMEDVYSFTDWKGLDWQAIHADLAAALSEGDDPEALGRVLGKLVAAIPDGHVLLSNDDPAREKCPEAAGTLGITLSDTDEGALIIAATDPAAKAAGVAVGDVVTAWDGLDIEAAIESAPIHCYPVGLATQERRRSARIRLLGRAPLDVPISLDLSRSGAALTATLAATDDGDDIRAHLLLTPPGERVAWELLADDVGYIRLGWEETSLSEQAFFRAVSSLWDDGARRLIVDLRDNDGGTDQAAANIVGVFTDREWFYETITMYDRRTESQAVISEVHIVPQEVYWDLPVVALINGDTVSSGEGIAMMLARLGVEIVGFEGTAASFGSTGSTTRLPDGWSLTWPAGRSLDIDGIIQLDSDDTLSGGVQPTHRIPWTADNRIAHAADPDGFILDYTIETVLGVP